MSELSISRVERVHRCSGCHDRLDGAAFDAALDCPRCGALAHFSCARDAPRCTRCGEELAVEVARQAHRHEPTRARRLLDALVLFLHELRTRPLELLARMGTERGRWMGIGVFWFFVGVGLMLAATLAVAVITRRA